MRRHLPLLLILLIAIITVFVGYYISLGDQAPDLSEAASIGRERISKYLQKDDQLVRTGNKNYPEYVKSELLGSNMILNIERLPYFNPDTISLKTSSYDRTGGNNDGHILSDQTPGQFSSYLRKETINDREEFVIFDQAGCGQINRMFFTGHEPLFEKTDINFYFEGASNPHYQTKIVNLFNGSQAPFLSPVVGDDEDSKGAYYSYVPIQFSNGLKITTSNQVLYYQIDHAKILNGCTHSNSDLMAPTLGFTVHNMNRLLGNNIYTQNVDGVTDINPNKTHIQHQRSLANQQDSGLWFGNVQTIGGNTKAILGGRPISVSRGKGGTITALKLRIMGDNRDVRNQLSLNIKWDGMSEPYVDIPLGHLFGTSLDFPTTSNAVGSLMLKTVKNDGYVDYFIYFPMPFKDTAEISILDNRPFNNAPLSIDYRVDYLVQDDPPLGTSIGYFRTHWRFDSNLSQNSENYSVLDIGGEIPSGRGVYVGTVMTLSGTNRGGFGFLEGDERIEIDRGTQRESILYGTGTEDYFTGGYYFNPNFPDCSSFYYCYDQRNIPPQNRQELIQCFTQDQTYLSLAQSCNSAPQPFSLPLHGMINVKYQHPTPQENSITMYRLHIADPLPFMDNFKFSFEHGDNNRGDRDNSTTYRSAALFYYYPNN